MCVRSSKKNSNSKQKSDIIIEITSKEKANKEANISKPSKVRKAEEESGGTNKINANKKETKNRTVNFGVCFSWLSSSIIITVNLKQNCETKSNLLKTATIGEGL